MTGSSRTSRRRTAVISSGDLYGRPDVAPTFMVGSDVVPARISPWSRARASLRCPAIPSQRRPRRPGTAELATRGSPLQLRPPDRFRVVLCALRLRRAENPPVSFGGDIGEDFCLRGVRAIAVPSAIWLCTNSSTALATKPAGARRQCRDRRRRSSVPSNRKLLFEHADEPRDRDAAPSRGTVVQLVAKLVHRLLELEHGEQLVDCRPDGMSDGSIVAR